MPIATLSNCKRCDAEITATKRRHGNLCDVCRSDDSKAWYQKNKVEARAKRKKYYAENRNAILDQMKERYHSDPEVRQSHIDSAIKSKHGISAEEYRYEYWRLYEMQNGNCAICRKRKKLVLDHCHRTGKIRGLLCPNCNTSLGLVKENLEIVEGLRTYIRKQCF